MAVPGKSPEEALRDAGLKAFIDALHSDRMVAITGAMTTENLGYPGWRTFIWAVAKIAQELAADLQTGLSVKALAPTALLDAVSSNADQIIKSTKQLAKRKANQRYEPDPRVRIWKLFDGFSAIDRALLAFGLCNEVAKLHQADSVLAEFEQRIAAIFCFRTGTSTHPGQSIVAQLIDTLGIRRIATLNYDFELERQLMLIPDERAGLQDEVLRTTPTATKFAKSHTKGGRFFRDLIGPSGSGQPILQSKNGRLSRTLLDGTVSISDVVDRERPDRLFEFAVGSARIQRHILHLHGRADIPAGLVAHIRDYDGLYRRDDLNREPFDHGLYTLIEGNPILFVGLGMTEPELNEKLQYLVGNTPRRQASPLFLLWNKDNSGHTDYNPYGGWEQYKQDMRSDFFERLGVYVLFDDDIAETANAGVTASDGFTALHAALGQIKALGDRLDLSEALKMNDLRGPSDRFNSGEGRWRMWGVEAWPKKITKVQQLLTIQADGDAMSQSTAVPGVVALIGPKGSGRGLLAEHLISDANGLAAKLGLSGVAIARNRLLINAGFAYDSDTVLSGIARFLIDRIDPQEPWTEPAHSDGRREDLFRWLGNTDGVRFTPSLIVINGADRFFSKNGAPISAGFDFMLRQLCQRKSQSGLTVVLLGSRRITAYCEQLGIACSQLNRTVKPKLFDSNYLTWVREKFADSDSQANLEYLPVAAQVGLPRGNRHDASTVSWKFFEAHLDPHLLTKTLGPGADYQVAIEVLRAMSFIGAPIEGAVLQYGPRIRVALAKPGADLNKTLERLCALGLILELNQHHADRAVAAGSKLRAQLALHTSLAGYLRDRFGAPLNDSKLANAFNLSVFMSDTHDANVPDQVIHDELAMLVDHLCGAWHDIDQIYPQFNACFPDPSFFAADAWQGAYTHRPSPEKFAQEVCKRAFRDSSACLRAAVAIVRSYFSTGALLKFQNSITEASATRSGALSEHARRIDRLLTSFNKLSVARGLMTDVSIADCASLGLHQSARLDYFKGPAALYAEEIVWLLNERAMVALVQGDLPAAGRALGQARAENKEHVEAGRLGRNWRRLTINVISVRIERGRLHDALDLLDQLEAEIDSDPWRSSSGQPPASGKGRRTAAIRHRLTAMHLDFGGNDQPYRGDTDFSREESFILALASGYRGLVAHMRGDFDRAEADYMISIKMLQVLSEKRGCAHFQRHYARLLHLLDRGQDAKRLADRSADEAKAARQWDLWHRSMIVQANLKLAEASTQEALKEATDVIRNARDYAIYADCYRVRIEANASIARRMRYAGNYGTALRHIADALGIACRYRHSLMITSLRIELGKILADRGDPVSGQAMIEQAIMIATTKGHNEGIERVSPRRNAQKPLYF